MEKETIEETAEKMFPNSPFYQHGFIEGSKWQAERMYSKEEVFDIFHQWFCYNTDEDVDSKLSFKQWFENL